MPPTKQKFVWDPKAPAVYFDPDDPKSKSVTNQSDKDSADINIIMERYQKTGLIAGQNRAPMYGDFTVLPNYYELNKTLAGVNQAFEALPAKTRNRFENDPQQLIDFLLDEKNDAEAIKLGLKTEKPPVENQEKKPEATPKVAPSSAETPEKNAPKAPKKQAEE
jgi:phage internal scaffolding protein